MATVQTGPEDADTAGAIDATHADVVNCIDLPLVLLGPDLSVVSFNLAAAMLLSLLPADIGRPIGSITELAGVRNLEDRCELVVAGGARGQLEFRNAEGAYFSVAIGAYKSAGREIAGAVLTFTNVTALHASLEQAIAEREYVKTIVNTIIEPLVVLDEDLRIQTANQAFYTLFGVSRKRDLSLSEVFDLPEGTWDGSPVHTFLTENNPSDGSTEALDVLHTIPALGERTLLLKARRIFQRHVGRVTVLAVQDITEQKAAEQVIRETMAVKDQFLSLVSHELRTPISTIFGNGLLLLSRADVLAEENKKQALVDIVDESRRLQRIIENLLILTRIDAGHELRAEPIRLQRLVEDAVAQFDRRSGRRISLTIDGEVSIALGEPELIREVVDNLMSNAQKYSQPDTLIEVVVAMTPDGQPRVSVLDRGIGFASDDASGLFSPFFRTKSAVNVATGMGLGLAVCKKIVESYGGMIQASRRDGGGSEFSFSLPPA